MRPGALLSPFPDDRFAALDPSALTGRRLAVPLPGFTDFELDAPVRRVAAKDTYVAYQPILEDAILPQTTDLYRAMKQLAEF